MEAPSVADAQSQLKLARTAVEHIHQALQTPTAKAGEAMCTNRNQSRRMVGHIEADAHGLRKLYVSQANPFFQKEVAEAAVRKKANPGKQLPKYWQARFSTCGKERLQNCSESFAFQAGAFWCQSTCRIED